MPPPPPWSQEDCPKPAHVIPAYRRNIRANQSAIVVAGERVEIVRAARPGIDALDCTHQNVIHHIRVVIHSGDAFLRAAIKPPIEIPVICAGRAAGFPIDLDVVWRVANRGICRILECGRVILYAHPQFIRAAVHSELRNKAGRAAGL